MADETEQHDLPAATDRFDDWNWLDDQWVPTSSPSGTTSVPGARSRPPGDMDDAGGPVPAGSSGARRVGGSTITLDEVGAGHDAMQRSTEARSVIVF